MLSEYWKKQNIKWILKEEDFFIESGVCYNNRKVDLKEIAELIKKGEIVIFNSNLLEYLIYYHKIKNER